jgi:hypothetical protein
MGGGPHQHRLDPADVTQPGKPRARPPTVAGNASVYQLRITSQAGWSARYDDHADDRQMGSGTGPGPQLVTWGKSTILSLDSARLQVRIDAEFGQAHPI